MHSQLHLKLVNRLIQENATYMLVHISLEDFNFYHFTDNGTCQKLYIPRNRIKTKETPFLWLHVLKTVYYYVPKYGMSELLRLWKFSKFHRIL